MNLILGIDVGTLKSKALLLDESYAILDRLTRENEGERGEGVRILIEKILGGRKSFSLKIGVTGRGREIFEPSDKVAVFNGVVSLALGAVQECREARSIIEIGGHTSRWVLLDRSSHSDREAEIIDFSLNERCAAGSGAFLEQQASRLRLGIREFSELAYEAAAGATVAGRCSVFAKSDMIHLQQKGTPVDEIAYGVCLALARNFVASILKGRECRPPVLFTGGAALNKGLARALKEILQRDDSSFMVSADPLYSCALGAAHGAAKYGKEKYCPDSQSVLDFLEIKPPALKREFIPLGSLEESRREEPFPSEEEAVRGYLGVDVGSISTNLSLVDREGRVRAGIYLPTRGAPLEVVREALSHLFTNVKGRLDILGVGTTGSGRYLAGRFLESDVIHNEITCQLIGARHFFPDADTIFEIGGQDSKYIRIKDGRIHDFTMNKICAAGTGSFLEEQAAHLGIRVEGEFSSEASRSQTPRDLGSQCTVFMDTELGNALAQGASLSDITAGLAYSIARNYLEKVVADRSIGENVVFQGGVASNPSVVKAFSLLLEKPVRVHPYNRISGAIGSALLAKKAMEDHQSLASKTSRLKKRINQPYTLSSFQCKHCTNRCQVTRIRLEGKNIYFGDTCERYTAEHRLSPETSKTPDLIQERNDLLENSIHNPSQPAHRIALPRASFMHEHLFFWISFFNHLGCEVILSPPTNMEILEMGLRRLPAETCLPIKIAFGHVQWLLQQNADYIFIPSPVDPHPERKENHYLCPYSEHLPHMLRSAFDTGMLSPCITFEGEYEGFIRSMSGVSKRLGRKRGEVKDAYFYALAAQSEFSESLKKKGRAALEKAEKENSNVWVLLGKPYNVYDGFLNLTLSRHLRKMGVVALPMEFIPEESQVSEEYFRLLPWRYNRQIIRSTLWCGERKSVFPVYISNFGCGPDAFTMKHLARILGDKPHLFLEFDEHRGEAGLITRLEAFFDEIKETDVRDRGPGASPGQGRKKGSDRISEYRNRRFVLPYFADHAFAYTGAMKGTGMEAEVLSPPDERSLSLGEQHSSGKECHAYSILAGDLVKFALSERKGNEVFYFPGTKHICLLAQYGEGMNYILDEMGIDGLEVLSPSTGFLFKILGSSGIKLLWQGLVAVDLMAKTACALRPYEVQKGQTDELHHANLRDIEQGLANGSFRKSWERCVERMGGIRIRHERRPVIGIAGDIYTRQHPVANHGLFSKLEDLGCEVWPPPLFVDDVDYGFRKSISDNFKRRRYLKSAAAGLLNLRKDIETWKIEHKLNKVLVPLSEPDYKSVLEFSSPYISPQNNRLLLLNIAKMVDFSRRGADGVINVICLNCMLGTVSEAISAQIKRDCGRIPIPTLVYSGSDSSLEDTKLEAFVYQAFRFAQRKKDASSI
jgi:predicted CoA-substrate-specific enzyme activase